MIQALLLAGLVALGPGDLVVSEIMYNPDGATLGDDDDMEWVELYNASGETLSLGGIMLSDGNNQLFLLDHLVLPGEYVVVCANTEAFIQVYGPGVTVVGWDGAWIKQSNSGDSVIIYDLLGGVVDEISYSDQWGADDDGRSPADGDGSSLEKRDLSGGSSRDNWSPSVDFGGPMLDDDPMCWGTPGMPNSTPSTLMLDTFSPPDLTMSFFRSTNISCPSLSMKPRSPLWCHPNVLTASVASEFFR